MQSLHENPEEWRKKLPSQMGKLTYRKVTWRVISGSGSKLKLSREQQTIEKASLEMLFK